MSINSRLSSTVGPIDRRVGVFGPYPREGTDVILTVAQLVSELGYNAITGLGTYRQNDPTNLLSFMDFFPSHTRKIKSVIPDRILFHELPRLTSKAIFYENDERGQFVELSACSEYKIPALGFIRDEQISKKTRCNFLLDNDVFSECAVKDTALCLHDSDSPFCPFYDSVDIPWFSKEILISKENGNRLVAVKRISTLRKIVEDFLKTPIEPSPQQT